VHQDRRLSYELSKEDVGDTIEVQETARNAGGPSTPRHLSGEHGWWWRAAATLGTTTVGASAESDPANLKAASKYTLPSAGTLSKLSLYLQPTGTNGDAELRGSSSTPNLPAPRGALLATTTALAFKSTST
jgi:hypothetical protein